MLIADDHHLFNEGIKQMLSTEPWLLVVGQVFSGCDVVASAQATSPHLLLLDVNFPGIDGFDIAAEVKKKMPSLKLVFLTMYSDALMVQKAKDLGANGYLLKTATQQELVHCIRTVMRGETAFFTAAGTGKEPV
ncbi:MAG TPA: response regulator transcription factor, partial [Flavisolibacter sp.]|nr:response regulator transcription factor [Flavisolibacter sp.]